MIQVDKIGKSFGDRVLFEDISFALNSKERVGLVGRNGCGKSTLFKLIQSEMSIDGGHIKIPKNYSIGHLVQIYNFTKASLIEEAELALPKTDDAGRYQAEKILFGLGFSKIDLEKNPRLFSGGFQLRINLAKLLIASPNLLLLDEPTNYLDIVGIRWFKRFLKSFPGEAIIISHQRDFLDDVCNSIMGISRQKLKKVVGNTEKYYSQISLEEEIHEQTRLNQEKKIKDVEKFVERFRATASKAAQVQSRVKMLNKMGSLEQLASERIMGLQFNYIDTHSKILSEIENVTFAYPNGPVLISNVTFTIQKNDRIGIIGKNGKGKSTLLNLISQNISPISGTVVHKKGTVLGHFGQMNIDQLCPTNNVVEEISAANQELPTSRIRAICGSMMFEGNLAMKKIAVLSGGEKGRVLLGQLVAKKHNLLLLDEPTNHLDMESTLALVSELELFEGAVVIVTHNEEILRKLVNRLIIFERGGVTVFDGGYDSFLEKIGWEGETSDDVSDKKDRPTRKDIKQQRSALIKDRAKSIGPIKERIDKGESKILELEATVKEKNGIILSSASSNKDGVKIAALSKEIKDHERLIEELFEALTTDSTFLSDEEEKFQKLLEELEN